MKSIYVFGLFPISPGKTVVSTALCRSLLRRGLKVAPFKPRSGHSLWYQYDAFSRCRKVGRLFCEDIIKLKEASGCPLPYEILNPVDALMAPLNAKMFLGEKRVREMYLKEGDTFLHLLVERYTSWMKGKVRNVLCLNKRNESEEDLIEEDYIRELEGKSEEVVEVVDVAGWDSVFRRLSPRCTLTCSRRIEEEYEVMVVEGFNDAVCPAPKLKYDVVVGVAPGFSALYDPDDFHRVIKVKSMMGVNPLGMRAKDIVEFIEPEKMFKIKTLNKRELIDYDGLSDKIGKMNKTVLDKLQFV